MKTKALKILNPILLLLLLLVLIGLSGYLITELDPWYKLHFISGILFLAGGLLHLILNWGWVRATYLRKSAKK